MCGIVGMVSKYSNGFSHSEAGMFETMLFLDTLRGWDSTGVFGVDNHGNVQLHKEASHGPDFICDKAVQDFFKEAIRGGKILVGHNRAATRGTVNDENAHPFCVDDKILLVQNGTMRGDHKKHADVEVDTHAIAHILAKEPDITKALESFDAAYALVWYNVPEQTLYIIRNTERPLWIAEFDGNGFMFASEKETIMYSAAKASQAPKFKGEPYALPAGTLMSFNLKDGTLDKKELSFRPKTYNTGWQGGSGRRLDHAAWANAMYGDGYEDAVVIQRTLPAPVGKMDDITISFTEIACKDPDLIPYSFGQVGQYSAMTMAEYATTELTTEANKNNGYAMVEVIDYKPANKHARCSRWHMIARLATEDEDIAVGHPKATVLVHYLLNNANEEDALATVGQYVEAKITGTQIMLYRDPVDSEQIALAHAFSTSVKAITVN